VVNYIRDENGKPLGTTVIAYDITERKLAEIALSKSKEEEQLHNGSVTAMKHMRSTALR
jgi:hypothetical protein